VEEAHHYHNTGLLGLKEEEETPMMMENDLDRSQKRGGKEDGMRNPHPRHKTNMMSRTTNSLTCFPE